MIPRWPAPPKRRTARTGRVAAVTVTALAAVLVQAALAAHANTPPAPPSGARLAAEPARHDLTRARMQVLAMATAALSQGPALSQAGTDLPAVGRR